MTVDGPEERPLALSDLAQAESPEIVRAALGRFRRRLLGRGLILALIVATGVFLYPRYFHDNGDLRREIEKSRGVDVNNVIKNGDIQANVLRVARLSRQVLVAPDEEVDRFGIQVFVTYVPTGPPVEIESYKLIVPVLRSALDRGIVFSQVESNGDIQNGFEMWISLKAGTPTIEIPVVAIAFNPGSPTQSARPVVTTLHIDMKKLAVPAWTWR